MAYLSWSTGRTHFAWTKSCGVLMSASGVLMSAKGVLMSGEFFNDFSGHYVPHACMHTWGSGQECPLQNL